MQITEIELQNVQAFADPVIIRFAPMTLFYGPNSAGKSTVEDVFELLRELTIHSEPSYAVLNRCKRRGGRIYGEVDNEMVVRIAITLSRYYDADKYDLLKIAYSFQGCTNEEWGANTSRRLEIYANGQLSFSSDSAKRCEDFPDSAQSPHDDAMRVLASAIDLSMVTASRQIPKANELVYFFDNGYLIAGPGLYQNDADFGLSKFNLPTADECSAYQDFAYACSWLVDGNAHLQPIAEEEYLPFFENVQRTMLDHLFVDTGYRIDYDYRLIVSPENFAKIGTKSDDEWLKQICPMYLRLFLRDKNGVELNFTDVGSGLGYVLPVILAVWNPEKSAYIQQPELHLHPALQSVLGDIFIDVLNANQGQVLIETHSEHLLLRVLRRIRQTSSGSLLNQEYSFSAEQVAVNYFLPRGDGTTEVRLLRVSETGDFLDRWPNGFFAERDEDLFSE